MAKKVNLPVVSGPLKESGGERERERSDVSAPSNKSALEEARNRLGGRTRDEAPAPDGIFPGRVVKVFANDGGEHVAIVVFANAEEVHLLIDGKRLRRVPPDAVHAHDGMPPGFLHRIAADAEVFGRLSEGEPVRYADDSGGLLAGKLIEKCRYGALIARDDGTIVAVGFRKLWPAATHGAASA